MQRGLRISSRLGVLAACLLLGLPVSFSAAAPSVPSAPIDSVFHIEKSANHNQVHYGVQVDPECRPVGARPVYAYWRNLEQGPRAMSAILRHEQPAYGLTEPRSVRRGAGGGEIRIGLRGFPDRLLTIRTFREANLCRARTFTTIANQPAVLRTIYVELGFLFSVDYVVVRGFRVMDGAAVQEKVDD
jgi:hypothetical protein